MPLLIYLRPVLSKTGCGSERIVSWGYIRCHGSSSAVCLHRFQATTMVRFIRDIVWNFFQRYTHIFIAMAISLLSSSWFYIMQLVVTYYVFEGCIFNYCLGFHTNGRDKWMFPYQQNQILPPLLTLQINPNKDLNSNLNFTPCFFNL